MKYRHDPERPTEPILEASPAEIDAHRRLLHRYVRAVWRLGDADAEDVVQGAIILGCSLIEEGRIRGSYEMAPEVRLRLLLRYIAWNVASNAARLLRSRAHVVIADLSLAEAVADSHSLPDKLLEARQTLDAVQKDRDPAVQVLIRMAMDESAADIARDLGREVTTIYAAAQRGRNKVLKKHRNARR